jgi:hypothetical protein
MRIRALFVLPILAALTLPPAAGAVGNATSASAIGKYWTDARMKSAKPREKARPGGGGGGSTAASHEYVGAYPTQQGKVFFSEGASNYVCSGTSVATNASTAIVWTAGHCVWDDAGGYVTNFMFVPAYKDGVAPVGKFAAAGAGALHTSASWAGPGDLFGADVGAVQVVNTVTGGPSLASVAPGRSIMFDAPTNGTYHAYGYPAAGKFNGQRLQVCDSKLVQRDTSSTPATLGIACDMTGGSSGGGWLTDANVLVSNVSYGYQSLKNVLFGPYLSTEAHDVFRAAGGS